MARFTFWTDKSRQYIILGCAFIVSTVLLSMGSSEKLFLVKGLTITVLAPVQRGISLANQFWDVHSQNRRLKRLSTELSLENQLLREAQLQNKRLRQLLDFREKKEWTAMLLTEVITMEPSREMNTITIGSGRLQRIDQYMPVVTAQGLVGRVSMPSENTSLVQLIKDRNCPVPAMIRRNRVSGILVYDNDFYLRNVPSRMDVVKGDTVISSGLGEQFPKGLLLGKVSKVFERSERQLFHKIEVEPAVDFNSLEEVFVILKRSPDVEEGER